MQLERFREGKRFVIILSSLGHDLPKINNPLDHRKRDLLFVRAQSTEATRPSAILTLDSSLNKFDRSIEPSPSLPTRGQRECLLTWLFKKLDIPRLFKDCVALIYSLVQYFSYL